MDNDKHYNFWVYVERSADDPAVWVGHCLLLDIVSWGSSPAEARDMVREAVEVCILDDLNAGLDPLERRRAPPEAFDKLNELLVGGRPVDPTKADVAEREAVSRFAMMISLVFTKNHAVDDGVAWPSLADSAA